MEQLWLAIVEYFNAAIDWFFELVQWLPKLLFAEILDALALVVEAIPVPGFIDTATGAFQSIPPTVLFFASKFALGEGVAMILAAYVLRFVIRRIPIIG